MKANKIVKSSCPEKEGSLQLFPSLKYHDSHSIFCSPYFRFLSWIHHFDVNKMCETSIDILVNIYVYLICLLLCRKKPFNAAFD